jgi:uracil-DNA glycosylase family protein
VTKKSHGSAKSLIPKNPTLSSLRKAAADCQACPVWENATQTVFGDGKAHAKVMFVGEQPGNDEGLKGKPFVGPAGRLLDDALELAGIDRGQTYVTNAVKHFKWKRQGKRRIHEKPNSKEIEACRRWLEAEIAVVKPKVVVALGATAAQTLLGKQFRVTRERGKFIKTAIAPVITATVHPSSILRTPDEQARKEQMQAFVDDLKKVARFLARES